jgi:CRP/FNR family transcriptional regulator, cyclic AMP receptor protein
LIKSAILKALALFYRMAEQKTATAHHPTDVRAQLHAHAFFKDLPKAAIDQIAQHAVVQRVRKGAILFRKGDSGSALFIVAEGAIRIVSPSGTDRDVALNVMIPGDLFGEVAMLDGGERTADGIAAEPCTLLRLERRDLMPLLRSHPDLAVRFIEVLCSRLRQTSERVEDAASLELPQRLAKTLLFLRDRSGSGGKDGEIRMTQFQLSEMIGASRESTNKQLREWQQSGIIAIGRGKINIHKPDALARLLPV